MAYSSAAVLVDSFRYLPPGINASECELYNRENTQISEDESASESTHTFWDSSNITVIVSMTLLIVIIVSIFCYCSCRKPVRVVVAA